MRSSDMREKARVLVVESDGETRRQLSAWLEAAGHEVVGCPGPGALESACPGSRDQWCPTAGEADVALVDVTASTDGARRGARAWQLCRYYLDRGKKVALVVGSGDEVVPLPSEDVVLLRRPAERPWVLAGVQALVGHATLIAPFNQVRVDHPGRPNGHDPAR